MANLAKWQKFIDEPRRFGYIAIFPNGEFCKHTTVYPKAYCIQARLAPWKRWQSICYDRNTPSVKHPAGHLLYETSHGIGQGIGDCKYKSYYEWFKDEHSAVRRIKQCLAMTQAEHHRWKEDAFTSNLNSAFNAEPYYDLLNIAPAQLVFGEALQFSEVLDDPRVVRLDALPPSSIAIQSLPGGFNG